MDDDGPDPLEPAHEWYRELADTWAGDGDAWQQGLHAEGSRT